MSELPDLASTFIGCFHEDDIADVAFVNQREDVPVVRAGAFDMVNGKLDAMLIAGFDHLIGLNQIEGDRFLTEDVDTALCRGDRWVGGASVPVSGR